MSATITSRRLLRSYSIRSTREERARSRSRVRHIPLLEGLEERIALSTYTITNSSTSGPGSLDYGLTLAGVTVVNFGSVTYADSTGNIVCNSGITINGGAGDAIYFLGSPTDGLEMSGGAINTVGIYGDAGDQVLNESGTLALSGNTFGPDGTEVNTAVASFEANSTIVLTGGNQFNDFGGIAIENGDLQFDGAEQNFNTLGIAIRNQVGTAYITNAVFNDSDGQGCIEDDDGLSTNVSDCTFNSSVGSGELDMGAFITTSTLATGSSLIVDGNTFTGASGGYGFWLDTAQGGTASFWDNTIIDCTNGVMYANGYLNFYSNIVSGSTGGIYLLDGGLDDSISGNEFDDDTTGIACDTSGAVQVNWNTFYDITGSAVDGEMFENGSLTIAFNTFVDNTSDGPGAAIDLDQTLQGATTLPLINGDTFVDNKATGSDGYGGAIYIGGTATDSESIVQSSLFLGGSASVAGPEVYGTVVDYGGNLIDNESGATGFGSGTHVADALVGSLTTATAPPYGWTYPGLQVIPVLTDSPYLYSGSSSNVGVQSENGVASTGEVIPGADEIAVAPPQDAESTSLGMGATLSTVSMGTTNSSSSSSGTTPSKSSKAATNQVVIPLTKSFDPTAVSNVKVVYNDGSLLAS